MNNEVSIGTRPNPISPQLQDSRAAGRTTNHSRTNSQHAFQVPITRPQMDNATSNKAQSLLPNYSPDKGTPKLRSTITRIGKTMLWVTVPLTYVSSQLPKNPSLTLIPWFPCTFTVHRRKTWWPSSILPPHRQSPAQLLIHGLHPRHQRRPQRCPNHRCPNQQHKHRRKRNHPPEPQRKSHSFRWLVRLSKDFVPEWDWAVGYD